MQTSPQIRQQLNVLLRHELTLINQCFLHSRMLNNWGYDSLGKAFYKQSIRAMKHADRLIERIFFLEGLPNLQDLGKLLIGENAGEALDCDLQAMLAQRNAQQQGIAFFETTQDYVSRALIKDQLQANEDYIDWLEEQQGLVLSLGLGNYLQSAVASEAK